jgi:hypothetical protein
MRRIIFSLFFVFIGVFRVIAQVGISAAPMNLVFDNIAGTTKSYTVTVSNPTARTLEAGITLADWDRDSTGDIRFYLPGSLSSSCANLIKVLPSTNFLIQPYEKKDFTVMMDLSSAKIDSAKNCMLFFTQLNTQRGANVTNGVGIGVNLTLRIGIQIFYNVPTATKKNIEIERFMEDTAKIKDTSIRKNVLLTLKNTGDIETDGKVKFELLNLKTGDKIDLPESKFYTLPNAIRVITVAIPTKTPRGKYSITALVDYGAEQELKIGELEIEL